MNPKIASSYTLVFSAILIICHAHSSNKISSPGNFLRDLNGTRKGDHAKGFIELKKYLERLGYMDYTKKQISSMHRNDGLFDDILESAIRKYQMFFKLETTGYLDEETMKLLMQPRCGTPDYGMSSKMSARYQLVQGWAHGVRNLTFTYETEVSPSVTAAVAAAIRSWERHAPFSFEYTGRPNAHVLMGFYQRDHKDGFPFDGRGGILAHAFYPPTGQLHFDADETWSMSEVAPAGSDSVDLQSVTLHELGHILGLGHSDYEESIMFPKFAYGMVKRHLFNDDIDAIRDLYPYG